MNLPRFLVLFLTFLLLQGCILVIYSSKDEARKAVDSSEVYSSDLKFQRETK